MHNPADGLARLPDSHRGTRGDMSRQRTDRESGVSFLNAAFGKDGPSQSGQSV
jgi:hypothetical protein